MLSASKTSDRKHPPPETKDKPDTPTDAAADLAAEFIHDLAESGAANELGTVKAASDAVEGKSEAARDPTKGRGGRSKQPA